MQACIKLESWLQRFKIRVRNPLVIWCFLQKDKNFLKIENADNDHIAEGELRTLAATAAKSLQSCLTLCNPIDPYAYQIQQKGTSWGYEWGLKFSQCSSHQALCPWECFYQNEGLFLINYPEWVLFLSAQIPDRLAMEC